MDTAGPVRPAHDLPLVPQAVVVQRHPASRLRTRHSQPYTVVVFGGMGGSRSNLRLIRIGLLVAVLLIGASLHHSGSTYNTIHVIYLVIIVGLLVASVVIRKRSGRGRRGSGGRGGYGSPPPAAQHDNSDPEAGG
jgi:hypothetical protein